ncbi:MAG: Asp-tRNA(Asn)/Glu-tRNA(Gln) amidotransferase subunit GatC [Chloroflexi bacterium]|nr:Asp-tRNA(Asn)/Glu-tRNA(Gln) amidotransferase subunit GatC [Chloroflexota bacterium]
MSEQQNAQIEAPRITREGVIRVADLAKVGLAEEEIEHLQQQLSSILDNIAILSELDTAAIPATAQVIPLSNVFRPDEMTDCLSPGAVLANAPEVYEDSFKIPAVMEEDEALRMDHPAVS